MVYYRVQLDFTLPSMLMAELPLVEFLDFNVQHSSPRRRSAGMYIVRLHFTGRHKLFAHRTLCKT